MIDVTLVKSGFDSELLFNRRYIRYLLMNSLETGAMPFVIDFSFDNNGIPVNVHIDLYAPEDYDRNYAPASGALLPALTSNEAFDVEILFDRDDGADLRIRLIGDVSGLLAPFTNEAVDIFTTFTLLFDTDDQGRQSNARVALSLIDVQGPIIDLAVSLPQVTKTDIMNMMATYVNREVPLSMVGNNGQVQSIAMQKLAGSNIDQDVIALYLNLLLRNGPNEEDVFADRGDINAALNFLPEGQDIAFGMPGSIYDRISSDAFQRTAVEGPEGSGNFSHPILSDPSDPESDKLGKIKSITIEPANVNGTFTDQLKITVHGELIWDVEIFGIDIAPDPDFFLYITIKPIITNGVISWDISYDLDFDPLLKFLINFVLASLVGALFIGTLGIGALAVGTFAFALLYGLEDALVEPLIVQSLMSDYNEAVDTGFLDAIPNRLTIESKRWDPFYFTDHQIVAKTDAMLIRSAGLGFAGKAMLNKAARFVNHVVARTEVRNENDKVTGLLYRVKDHLNAGNDFTGIFPGTDRETFVQVTGDEENNLFALTREEIKARIDAGKLAPRILYNAQKVHLKNHQVHEISAISERELNETIAKLIDDFENAEETSIRASDEDALRDEATQELTAELGTAPTDEQVEERLQDKIDELVIAALDDYSENRFDEDLDAAIAQLTRFDLAPFEMASLQIDKALMLSRYEMIIREGKPYYRDHPDGFRGDNLMEQPKFKPDKD